MKHLVMIAMLVAFGVQAQTVTNYTTTVTSVTTDGVTITTTNKIPKSVTTTSPYSPFSIPANGTITTAVAQPTTNPPASTPETPQSFFTTVESYLTSFNTNSQTFGTNAPWTMGLGASYQQGLNLGGTAFFEYKPFKGAGLQLGEVSTLAGVVGTIAQEEVDLGYAFRHYDLELSVGALGIDTFHSLGNNVPAGLKGGVYAEVKKALTQNTFLGIKIQDEWGGKGKGAQPPVTFFTGFTF